MVAKKHGRQHLPKEQPKPLKDSFHLNEQIFRWTFADCFWEHTGWQNFSLQFFAEHILNKLQDYEQQTWQEILNASGGKTQGHGNNSHFIAADKLPRNEKMQFIKHGYMEKFDKVFSLRLTGKERLIGFADLNVLHVLWFDANHEFFN